MKIKLYINLDDNTNDNLYMNSIDYLGYSTILLYNNYMFNGMNDD